MDSLLVETQEPNIHKISKSFGGGSIAHSQLCIYIYILHTNTNTNTNTDANANTNTNAY